MGKLLGHLGRALFDSSRLPFVLPLVVLAFIFVFFRMKNVELDYQISELKEKKKKTELVGKQLKASHAKLFSTGNLRKMANRHGLTLPTSSQIIVISE